MFTIPLYDDNPTIRTPFVTWALIAACVTFFLWQVMLPPAAQEATVYALGVVPAVLFGRAELPAEIALIPPWASIFSSMFLHGSWMHLAGNMLYLWIFGNNVEDAMGHFRFIVFYLLCGAAAALAQSLAAPESTIPMIGASGAIAGVLGSYLLLHPRANVRVLFIILFFIRLINVPAVIVLGLWFVVQIASGAMAPADQGGVAFWAHVGGFVAGMGLIALFKERGVPLFDAPHSRPFTSEPARSLRRTSIPSVPRRGEGRRPWNGRSGPWG